MNPTTSPGAIFVSDYGKDSDEYNIDAAMRAYECGYKFGLRFATNKRGDSELMAALSTVTAHHRPQIAAEHAEHQLLTATKDARDYPRYYADGWTNGVRVALRRLEAAA